MIAGLRLVMAIGLLGAIRLASGVDAVLATPDAVATRVQTLLHERYEGRDRLAVVDRVFDIEKRIGAYRAAQTKAELIYRLNADLRVATKDRRVGVREQSQPPMIGETRYDLGFGLVLYMPESEQG